MIRSVNPVFSVLEREAHEVTESPFGSVGVLHEGNNLRAWWIWKEREEVDPEWTTVAAGPAVARATWGSKVMVVSDAVPVEPGLDLHEWESMWASVEEGMEDDPAAAVSQFADIVERMLSARGYHLDDPVERAGDEPEIVVTYVSARATAERAEVGEASRADVETAIEDLRALFETLVSDRP
jgi:hypothetical protein